MSLKWSSSGEIAEELLELYPNLHPLSVRFTDLRDWVVALEAFSDAPDKCSEGILEAIQMNWYEEWKEENPDVTDPYDFQS